MKFPRMTGFVFSTSALLSLSALSLSAVAGNKGAQQQQQQMNGLTLQQVIAMCRTSEANEQIQPFKSGFTCNYNETMFVPVGTKSFTLENEGGLWAEAMIKEGMYRTELVPLPYQPTHQNGVCTVLEEWSRDVTVDVTFSGCAELEKIADHAAYCKAKAEDKLVESNHEVQDAKQQTPFAPVNGAGSYSKTGTVLSCNVDGPVQALPEDGGSCGTKTAGQQESQDDIVELPVLDDDGLTFQDASDQFSVTEQVDYDQQRMGTTVSVKHVPNWDFLNVLHSRRTHPVVQLDQTPDQSSWLDQAGLHKGDLIRRVNRERVRTAKDLKLKLKIASNSTKSVRIEFQRVGGKKWESKDVRVR